MADEEKTIIIRLETKQAEKNTDALGSKLAKTKGKAQDFSGILTQGAGGLKSYATGLLKVSGILAAVTGAFNLTKAAIQSNLTVSRNLERAQAGLSGILQQITADLGSWIERITESEDKQSFLSKALDWGTDALSGFMQTLNGVGLPGLEAYKMRLDDAREAAERLNEIQFQMKEAQALNNIEISQAKQDLELLRLASRDAASTDLERYQAQQKAVEQVKILRKEQEDSLQIKQDEINALREAAAGTQDLYDVRMRQHELDKQRIETETGLIMLENTLTERLNTLQKAYITNLETQSNLTEEVEEFDLSIYDSNIIIQQRNEVLITQGEVEREAAEKVRQHGIALDETTEKQKGYNSEAQKGLGIAQAGINLFKDGFSARGFINLLAAGANFIPGVGPLISAGLNIFGGLFKKGGVIKGAGGLLVGPSHSSGGIKYMNLTGGPNIELEGGEGVINKNSMSIPWVRDLASYLNQVGGGVKFASGGILNNQTALESQTARLEKALNARQVVAVVEDIQRGLDTVRVQENISSI